MAALWESIDLAIVNGNDVRLRTMENFIAEWHIHADSDELFYVLSGLFCLDTDEGTTELRTGEVLVAQAGARHRGRVEVKTIMLVVNRIEG